MPIISGNISSNSVSLNGDLNVKSTKWGLITGDIDEQTDLISALDEKQDEITNDNKLSASLISGLSSVATSGSYNDLSNKPTISDSTISFKKNGSLVQSITLNQTNDQDVNIVVPTKTSDLTKDDVYTKTESDTLLNTKSDKSTTYTKTETDNAISNHHDSTKQNTLVSGTNIKTINSQSILGSGNIVIEGANAVEDVKVNGTSVVTNKVANVSVPTKTSDITNDGDGTNPFLTQHQSLANYYTKSESDTEINNHHDQSKQDVISDLSTIRSGASLGASSIQPSDNVSELTNDAGYLTDQSLSNYYTKSETDTAISNHHDSTKQNVLSQGRNISISNNTISTIDALFYCTTTTLYPEITAAIDNGQLPVIKHTVSSTADVYLKFVRKQLISGVIQAIFEEDFGGVIYTRSCNFITETGVSMWSVVTTRTYQEKNLVTSFSSTTSNTKYPSEKLVKDNLDNIRSVAEGKTKSYVINAKTDITGTEGSDGNFTNVTAITGVTIANLKIGDVILIKAIEVPDYWVSQISPSVSLHKMETTKIDLTNYYTKTETDTEITNHHDSSKYDASNPNGYTSNTGTLTGITMNGASKGTSGNVDLGSVVTDLNSVPVVSFGTCNTAAATSEKEITITSTTKFELVVGAIIGVKFSVTNSASNVTLNVNNTGAKSIYYNASVYTSSSINMTGYANRIIYYMYDGTYWCWLTINSQSDSDTIPSAYCVTAASTAAKTAACSNFTLTNDTYGQISFRYANSSASALTLNINSKGAKPIYINGVASSSSNYTLPAGTYIYYYDGTNFYLRTDARIEYLQSTKDKVTSISSSSTDSQYPSAKCVYDIVGNIESLLEALR